MVSCPKDPQERVFCFVFCSPPLVMSLHLSLREAVCCPFPSGSGFCSGCRQSLCPEHAFSCCIAVLPSTNLHHEGDFLCSPLFPEHPCGAVPSVWRKSRGLVGAPLFAVALSHSMLLVTGPQTLAICEGHSHGLVCWSCLPPGSGRVSKSPSSLSMDVPVFPEISCFGVAVISAL